MSSSYPTPNRFWVVSPRIDYQINANNTLVVRYQSRAIRPWVGGVGNFNLPTQTTESYTKTTRRRSPRP